MNVVYDDKRARRASIIKKTEALKKFEKEERESFNKGIRLLKPGIGDEGRLSMFTL